MSQCARCKNGMSGCMAEPPCSPPKVRRFIIWAHVNRDEHTVEMPAGATDDECEEACQAALDTLIGNGDTGWNELDGSES